MFIVCAWVITVHVYIDVSMRKLCFCKFYAGVYMFYIVVHNCCIGFCTCHKGLKRFLLFFLPPPSTLQLPNIIQQSIQKSAQISNKSLQDKLKTNPLRGLFFRLRDVDQGDLRWTSCPCLLSGFSFLVLNPELFEENTARLSLGINVPHMTVNQHSHQAMQEDVSIANLLALRIRCGAMPSRNKVPVQNREHLLLSSSLLLFFTLND